jgi:hypothetical protein
MPKHSITQWILIPLILVLISLPQARESETEIRREISRVEKEAQREKQLHDKEKQKAQEFSRTSQEKLSSLKTQAFQVQSQTDSLRKELEDLQIASRKMAGSEKWFISKREKASEELAQYIDSLIPQFESGFPYRKEETTAAMTDLSAQLKRKVLNADEGIGRLWDILLDQIRQGYTAETYTGYLSLGEGQSLPGKYLRYGTVFMAFVTQDESQVYILQPKGGVLTWTSVGESLELRRSIKDAIKVSEGKLAPQLVPLPISAHSIRGAK